MKGEGFAPNNEAKEKCPTDKACVPVVTFEEGHPQIDKLMNEANARTKFNLN